MIMSAQSSIKNNFTNSNPPIIARSNLLSAGSCLGVVPVKYNGTSYRSTTEARWAVFFDAMQIPYQYEYETYDLGDGGWYLPDFWLPVQNCFIEIKGKKPTKDEEDKARNLAAVTHNKVYIFFGLLKPVHFQDCDGAYGYFPFFIDGTNDWDVHWDNGQEWTACPLCGSVDITYLGKCCGRMQCCEGDRNYENDKSGYIGRVHDVEKTGMSPRSRLLDKLSFAASYRFYRRYD